MKTLRPFIAITAAAAWISISEFARNQFLVKSLWTKHYEKMGLVFPSETANGAVWGIWSLLLAITVYFLMRKFSLLQTTLLAWMTGFVMMWVVIGNLGVLPYGTLIYALPLSLLESFIAALIIKKIR